MLVEMQPHAKIITIYVPALVSVHVITGPFLNMLS